MADVRSGDGLESPDGRRPKAVAPYMAVGLSTVVHHLHAGLVINNLLLSVILGIVFLGTLYPLFVEAVSGEKLSVGAPTRHSLRRQPRCWAQPAR